MTTNEIYFSIQHIVGHSLAEKLQQIRFFVIFFIIVYGRNDDDTTTTRSSQKLNERKETIWQSILLCLSWCHIRCLHPHEGETEQR
mmetsp:Transcript_2444/g.3393  ORF Transcript_2444/g.3393 Transcript_2444/m.3393 type:complete len:86 (+) Transcript_2444:64-321(+)